MRLTTKQKKPGRSNYKNCRILGEFSDAIFGCGFFYMCQCNNLMRSFWKQSCDMIAITEKRHLLHHFNSKNRTPRTKFSQNTILCKFGTYHASFSKLNIKMYCASLFQASWSFPRQVNICYHLLDGQVVEKVNFDPCIPLKKLLEPWVCWYSLNFQKKGPNMKKNFKNYILLWAKLPELTKCFIPFERTMTRFFVFNRT